MYSDPNLGCISSDSEPTPIEFRRTLKSVVGKKQKNCKIGKRNKKTENFSNYKNNYKKVKREQDKKNLQLNSQFCVYGADVLGWEPS